MSTTYALPPEVTLEYLAEGAANIVYKVNWPSFSSSEAKSGAGTRTPPTETDLHTLPSVTSSTTPPPTEIDPTNEQQFTTSSAESYPPQSLHNRLLRLRKAVPWIPSYAQLYKAQITLINPQFLESDLVPQTLVALPKSLVDRSNEALRAAEAAEKDTKGTGRPPKRHALYLATDEPHGLLVEDMSASPSEGQTLVEVKAKWLAQSPNAPAGSTCCRTCALRAMRRAQQAAGTKSTGGQSLANVDKDFCPLALGSGDEGGVRTAVSALLVGALSSDEKNDEGRRTRLQDALVGFFLVTPVLSRIRALQERFDLNGILAVPEGTTPGNDFLVATTLRDCTLFVRTSRLAEGSTPEVEGRLGDLDLKAPEPGKIDYWRGLEQDLIDGGWYMGKGADGKCWLEDHTNNLAERSRRITRVLGRTQVG